MHEESLRFDVIQDGGAAVAYLAEFLEDLIRKLVLTPALIAQVIVFAHLRVVILEGFQIGIRTHISVGHNSELFGHPRFYLRFFAGVSQG